MMLTLTSSTIPPPQSAIDPSCVWVCGNMSLRRLSAKGATHNPVPSSSSLTHTLFSCCDGHISRGGILFSLPPRGILPTWLLTHSQGYAASQGYMLPLRGTRGYNATLDQNRDTFCTQNGIRRAPREIGIRLASQSAYTLFEVPIFWGYTPNRIGAYCIPPLVISCTRKERTYHSLAPLCR